MCAGCGLRLRNGRSAGRSRQAWRFALCEWDLASSFAFCETRSVNVISRRELFAAADQHPETRQFVANFYRVVRRAEWRGLMDVRKQYPSADLVGQVLVVNVLGNHFRPILA